MTNASLEEISATMDYYNFIRWAISRGFRAYWTEPSTVNDTVRFVW